MVYRKAANINYFETINSKEKAYWLGYICADGNIAKKGNTVTIVSKDLERIEEFKNALSAEHTIDNRSYYDKRTLKTYISYSLRVTSFELKHSLERLGVTSNKTDKLEMPNIEEKYYPYFFAGLFDGDGSLSYDKYLLRVNLVATKEILDFLDKYLLDNLGIQTKKRYKILCKHDNVYLMKLYKDSIKFLDWIYQDENFSYMKRKYEKYKQNKISGE